MDGGGSADRPQVLVAAAERAGAVVVVGVGALLSPYFVALGDDLDPQTALRAFEKVTLTHVVTVGHGSLLSRRTLAFPVIRTGTANPRTSR